MGCQGCRHYLIHLFKSRRVLLVLVIISLFATEAFLSMWTGLGYDMKVWFQTGVWMNQGTNIYLPNDHLGYPPLWAFWCLASYRVFNVLGNNMEIWRFTLKLPLILAQFALAFAIGKFAAKRFDSQTAQKIFLVSLTWIFFIYIGALWGQLNTLSAMLTFLAFYAATSRRTIVGAVLLGLSITLKIFPLITLPAFAAFIWKNRSKKETGRFLLFTGAVPAVFTFAVFAAYQWDILYFFKTVFYWAPVFDVNPVQMHGGGMNIWSFLSLVNVEISQVSLLRFIWIPLLAIAAIYWFRKPKMNEENLNLSIISFNALFILSYAWVPEQSFLDLLPFVFLQIFGYRTKRLYIFLLVIVQLLVFTFSAFNWGPFIFEPLLTQFSPATLQSIQFLDPSKSSSVWAIRGVIGLAVSVSLAVFLLALVKPEIFEKLKHFPRKSTLKENHMTD